MGLNQAHVLQGGGPKGVDARQDVYDILCQLWVAVIAPRERSDDRLHYLGAS